MSLQQTLAGPSVSRRKGSSLCVASRVCSNLLEVRWSWFPAIAKRSVMIFVMASETEGSWLLGFSPGLDAVSELDEELGE